MSLSLFAACLPGLEPLLADELRQLGAEPEPLAGGVAFAGPVDLLLRAHLHLGTASHLLLRCARFHCRSLGELERKTALAPWREWLRADVPFVVRATARKSRIYHTGAIEERVTRGIQQALGTTAPAGEGAEAIPIAARFLDDEVTLSLDTAAVPLHRRGYRLATGKAPLREDLAFALLRAAGFARGQALLDPFCGSGTIAIEGAMIAAGLPPGRLRPPPLGGTALADDARWRALVADAPAVPDGPIPGSPVLASDRDAGAIEAAAANAARAGVAALIELQCRPFSDNPWLRDPGTAPSPLLLATNPPFGRRVGSGDLVNLHQALGHRAGRLSGARFAFVAADPRLLRRTGLELRQAFATRHGGLRASALIG